MTTPSGDVALQARLVRAEMALATQRELTRVYMAAWRELKESLSPGTPRVQLAAQMQERINTETAALQNKPEVQDEAIW